MLLIQQEGTYSVFLFTNNADQFLLFLPELFSIVEKMYATTTVIYFSINCLIIANMLSTIRKEVRAMCERPFTTALASSKLNLLQNHHVQICHSIELLNDSFGLVLLLEILFIFIALTNTIMKFLISSGNSDVDQSDFMLTLPRSILIFTLSANLFIICYSAENIKIQVVRSFGQIGILIYSKLVSLFFFFVVMNLRQEESNIN